jgi:murein DD-endopeptidase MepM/ murein hydrolase activator NlpD
MAFMISQAPGGIVSTHVTQDTLHAVDFAMPEGTPVVAAREGVVIALEWRHAAGGTSRALLDKGNYVRVRHADDTIATYAHLAHAGVAVEPGEFVAAGRILGYSGATGFASGPHLHFAVTRETFRDGALAEISEPVMFYVGNPPVVFAPRMGLAVTAGYSSPAEAPRPSRGAPERTPWPDYRARAGVAPGIAWLFALAFGLAGIVWFWRFSRR